NSPGRGQGESQYSPCVGTPSVQLGASATGELAGPDVESQTHQVFRNMQAILEAAGSDLSRVLRCGVFLVDLRDFEKMNRVYAEVFGEHRPARTTVQVASLPDPGLRVEIDAIAYRD
ncbi:MAG TPA: RidA family protein, partial [Gemmatimonadetes bacterium]|nr:RidA family protein [Gemmatimonadota bacterium]